MTILSGQTGHPCFPLNAAGFVQRLRDANEMSSDELSLGYLPTLSLAFGPQKNLPSCRFRGERPGRHSDLHQAGLAALCAAFQSGPDHDRLVRRSQHGDGGESCLQEDFIIISRVHRLIKGALAAVGAKHIRSVCSRSRRAERRDCPSGEQQLLQCPEGGPTSSAADMA